MFVIAIKHFNTGCTAPGLTTTRSPSDRERARVSGASMGANAAAEPDESAPPQGRLWPRPARLGIGEIHIWRAPLPVAAPMLADFEQVLSAGERQHARRFCFAEDAQRFVAGRGWLRFLLAGYLGCQPREVRFAFGQNGKPRLEMPGELPLQFNVTHSRDLALYAVTLAGEIGIDLEPLRRVPEAKEIAARYFSPREYDEFLRVPAEEQAHAFLNAWTRKEAFLKACGEGLTDWLNEIEMTLAPGAPAALRTLRGSVEAAARWTVLDLPHIRGHIAACVLEGQPREVHCWDAPMALGDVTANPADGGDWPAAA